MCTQNTLKLAIEITASLAGLSNLKIALLGRDLTRPFVGVGRRDEDDNGRDLSADEAARITRDQKDSQGMFLECFLLILDFLLSAQSDDDDERKVADNGLIYLNTFKDVANGFPAFKRIAFDSAISVKYDKIVQRYQSDQFNAMITQLVLCKNALFN